MASVGLLKKSKKRKGRGDDKKWNPVNPITPTEKARAVIGSLVKILHEDDFRDEVGIQVTEVFKGGSMGHGTTVPGRFDIDLVLYSRSLKIQEVDDGYYEKYLDSIGEYLEDKLKDQYTFEDTTNVAIKFSIQPPGQTSIDIDLILSPFFDDHHEYLQELKQVQSPEMRHKMFSVSSSKFQTEFIRCQHIWIKEFIRRAKAWRNIKWADTNDGKPKSYMMSILVIIAFDRLPPDMTAVCRGGMRKLVPLMTEQLKAVVRDIKSNSRLDLSVPGSDRSLQRTYRELLPDCPRIIDPANPANNLYLSGIQRSEARPNKWAPLADKIASLDLSPAIMQKHKERFG